MSNKTPSIKATLAKGLYDVIDYTNKVVPVNKFQSVYCLTCWLDSVYRMEIDDDAFIKADYYNGSENDLTDIFLEILKLATYKHCYNRKYVLGRLKFLADEGLHIIELLNAKNPSFKVSPEEADKIIFSLIKKNKKAKKVSKKKPAKRVRRDKTGRFIKNK